MTKTKTKAKSKKSRFWSRSLLLASVLILLMAGLALSYAYHWFNSSMNLPEQGKTYQLDRGETLGHLSARLSGDGVLKYPRLLRLYARLTDSAQVQAGEYFIPPETSPRQLLAMLRKGEVVLHQVTIVEGWTYRQALTELHRHNNIEPLLKGKSQEQQLVLLDLDLEHPEGWFFPDSYHYASGTSDVEILRRAHQKMRSLLEMLWETRELGLPYETPYQALIMASIVERETGAPWERDQIAGVFVRRLQRGMRLQTDPTVIYGMGEAYQGKIGRADLRRPTPYNTYTIKGLPPTPIALPGAEAVRASLNPAEGDALYFVARGDGTHVFSETLAEHNKAVREYQLKRRQDYRSAPPVESPRPEGSEP